MRTRNAIYYQITSKEAALVTAVTCQAMHDKPTINLTRSLRVGPFAKVEYDPWPSENIPVWVFMDQALRMLDEVENAYFAITGRRYKHNDVEEAIRTLRPHAEKIRYGESGHDAEKAAERAVSYFKNICKRINEDGADSAYI